MKAALQTGIFSLTLFGVPTAAGAVEIYATTDSPPPVVIVRPVTVWTPPIWSPPHLVPVLPPPTDPVPPLEPPTHPQPEERRDPRASVFVGAGYGGMSSARGTAGTWRLHLGLGLGATEIGLRADVANRAMDQLSDHAGTAWRVGAEVAHRFLEGATVRPVIAGSFDRWQFEPDGAPSAGAFGAGARLGVEVHYHVGSGAALVFGADAGYHRILASIDQADVAKDIFTFGATLDLRL